MTFEPLSLEIIKNIMKADHREFMRIQGLAHFIGLDWATEFQLNWKDLNKFVDSWNPIKEAGYYQGSLIKTNRQKMIEIFQLLVRGEKIR